jgi:hypothetical protein
MAAPCSVTAFGACSQAKREARRRLLNATVAKVANFLDGRRAESAVK